MDKLNLKNKTERETFLKDYRSWLIWLEVPELNLVFYHRVLANGAELIVTEYVEYFTYRKEYKTKHRFCLRLPESEPYVTPHSGFENHHRTYTLDGCSFGAVVDYMTKNRTEI